VNPQVLSAAVNLAAGANSPMLDLAAMSPLSRRPMLVKDISFIIRSPSVDPTVLQNTFTTLTQAQFGHIIRVRMRVGANDITNGFVPLVSFGPTYNTYYDAPSTLGFGTTYLVSTLVAGKAEAYNHWRWILPRPMYIAPGEGLQIQFFRSAALDPTMNVALVNGSFNVRAMALGELLPKPLTGCTRSIPYVSAFVTESNRQSGETDLKNILPTPITLQRFVGQNTIMVTTVQNPTKRLPQITDLTSNTLQLDGSDGYAITCGGFVTWRNLFPYQHPVWTFRRVLNPNELIKAKFSASPSNINAFALSIVGHREEPIS